MKIINTENRNLGYSNSLLVIRSFPNICFVCLSLDSPYCCSFSVIYIMNCIILNIHGIGDQGYVDRIRKLANDHNISCLYILAPLIEYSKLLESQENLF